jgi:peptidoglycan/xylan/chitin deacetylase (PgdA/CDA1 family)
VRELTRPRRLRHRLEPGGRALILLYHRIDAPATDPWHLAVSPERFAEQLELLHSRYRPMPLAELVDGLTRRRLPPRAVAVTFDDGYADNLLNGLPLLARHAVPATVYVTAGSLDARREFWWKQLEQLLLEPGPLPPRLEVRVGAFTWSGELDAVAEYSREEALRHRTWCVSPGATHFPTPRHAAFQTLLQELEPLPRSQREAILDALFAQAGVARSIRPSHRMLTEPQLRELAAGDLVDIGAHTMTHPHLAGLPPHDQEVEIVGSKRLLQTLLDRPVTSFAYPFGTAMDFDRRTVGAVRAAGFTSAAAVSDIAVSRSSDRFALPRVGIKDWTGAELERRLEWWERRYW